MKRMLGLLIAGGLALSLVASSSASPFQQGAGCTLIYTLSDGETLWICPPGATDTPVPPTAEPTATQVANHVPNPNDPLCPTHDPTVWHGLYDPVRDCHYTHAHGMPQPSWAEPLFGSEITSTIWTVSYPWETPDENLRKHAGYIMHAYDFRDAGCQVRGGTPSVDAYIAETHGVALGVGKLARFHSFALAAELCNEQGSAGLIFTGGQEDYGQLISPYKGNFVSTPKFPVQEYNVLSPPYVGEAKPDSVGQVETWNSVHRGDSEPFVDFHKIGGIAFRIRDAVDYVDPATYLVGDPQFITINEPENNGSAYQLYQIEIQVPDLNGDGSPVTGNFWTDVHGNIVDGCTAASENCVPLILQDAVPGSYRFNAGALGLLDNNNPADYYDQDIWFCGNDACPAYSEGAVPSGWQTFAGFGELP